MFYKTKKSILKLLCTIFTKQIIEIVFMTTIILSLCSVLDLSGLDFFKKIDITVFVAIIVAFIVNILAKSLAAFIHMKLEDITKLSDDYESIIKQYPGQEVISYENKADLDCICFRKKLNQGEIKFPIILDKLLVDATFKIVDFKNKQYELPQIVKDNYDEIMQAHEFSDVYNQLNIRLDNYKFDTNKNLLTLETSRTTYFDSLVTNRAMDYEWGFKCTNRKLLEYGPFVNSLSESKLSNHLGFNGFVETSDNKIIFVHRSNNVSIGKGTLGSSIGASLKTMYALDDNKNFTETLLVNSMKKEIKDELCIQPDCYEFSQKNIIALYRDLVEGGKPQFLFYVKIKNTSEEVKQMFYNNKCKNKKHLQDKLKKDGNKLMFIDSHILTGENIAIFPESIIYNKTRYITLPSVSASIVILRKYFKAKER